jgi:uncharacterized protein YukJ
MALEYGVLRARPDLAKREDGGSTPHLQIRALDATGQPRRVAVNVQSDDGSEVVFWILDPLVGHPILAALATTPSGYTTTGANSSASLDFVKAPLFDFALGRALPPSGSANADDLQDLLTLYLDQCKAAGGELYAFGAKFDWNLHKPIDAEFGNTDGLHGVHDIHMNQGNVGAHRHTTMARSTMGDCCCRSPIGSWACSWRFRPSASRPMRPGRRRPVRSRCRGSSRPSRTDQRWSPPRSISSVP